MIQIMADLINELLNNKGVCRTASATPGVLIILDLISHLDKFLLLLYFSVIWYCFFKVFLVAWHDFGFIIGLLDNFSIIL